MKTNLKKLLLKNTVAISLMTTQALGSHSAPVPMQALGQPRNGPGSGAELTLLCSLLAGNFNTA